MSKSMPILSINELLKIEGYLSKFPGFDKETVTETIDNFIELIDQEDFYQRYFEDNKKSNLIDYDSILKLIIFLKNKNLSAEEIKKIIVKTPGILAFSKDLDNIYVLFKGNILKGYVLLNNQDFKAYRYVSNHNFNVSKKSVDYTYVIDKMLNELKREDISKAYNLNKETISAKYIFNSLKKEEGLKNHYFKK